MNVKELQRHTGLRVYTEAPDGIELWDGDTVVSTEKNRPCAAAYMRGWLGHMQKNSAVAADAASVEEDRSRE